MNSARDQEITRRLAAMTADEKEELQYKAAGRIGMAGFIEFTKDEAMTAAMREIVGEQIDGEQKRELDSTVPFHEADLDKTKNAVLTNGYRYALSEGRFVEVWKVEGQDGLCVRLYHPTKDGKLSKLVFGIRTDAACCLLRGLDRHLVVASLIILMGIFPGCVNSHYRAEGDIGCRTSSPYRPPMTQ